MMISSCECSQPSALSDSLPQPVGQALKTIQDLSEWGYNIQLRGTKQQETGPLYDYLITHPDCELGGHPQPIDLFQITNAEPSRLDIQYCWNAWNDNRPVELKLSLRDLIMSFWKWTERNPKQLRQIYYHTILEESLIALTPSIFQIINRPMRSITIRREGTGIGEKKAFELLVYQTAFGSGIRKMLSEYREMAGIRIEAFQYIFHDDDVINVDLGDDFFDFVIHLGPTPSD